jgi:hypothetical protein
MKSKKFAIQIPVQMVLIKSGHDEQTVRSKMIYAFNPSELINNSKNFSSAIDVIIHRKFAEKMHYTSMERSN